MIIKVIQHNNMTHSVNYLYQKMENKPSITGSHDKYLTNLTAESFLLQSSALKDEKAEELSKELEVNNNIKHLVLSFHGNDHSIFDEVKDKIIEDLYEEVGIDPENHLANVFIHHDKGHPHIHVLFSRVGQDMTVFNDQKIGKRAGEFAKKMNEKYNLHHPKKNDSKITIDRKYLQNPTVRGDLLKLIDYATKEAKDLQDFQNILRRHGVNTRINKDFEIIYMVPNKNMPSKEEVAQIIETGKKQTKNHKEFKDYLQKKGVFVKIQPDGKETYSVKKVIAWNEEMMPHACRMKQLYKNIRTKNHDPKYVEYRDAIKSKIDQCKNLQEIQNILPDSRITYDVRGTKVYNIIIHHDDYQIRLNEAFTKEVEFRDLNSSEYMNIPIIFTSREHDEQWEKLQHYLARKHNRSRKRNFRR